VPVLQGLCEPLGLVVLVLIGVFEIKGDRLWLLSDVDVFVPPIDALTVPHAVEVFEALIDCVSVVLTFIVEDL